MVGTNSAGFETTFGIIILKFFTISSSSEALYIGDMISFVNVSVF